LAGSSPIVTSSGTPGSLTRMEPRTLTLGHSPDPAGGPCADVLDHLGFGDWPKGLRRHTAAAHLLARKQDAAAVALELGNSPRVLLTHYRELVIREQANKVIK